MKNRVAAAVLAFIFGAFGVHKFYLRDPGAGIFYIILFFITSRFFPVTGILGILDAVRLLMMTDEEFDKRYNNRVPRGRTYREHRRNYKRQRSEREPYVEKPVRRQSKRVSVARKRVNPFKKSGIRKYKEFDLEDAIEDFIKGLEIEPQDIALHFNIACAYSLTEQKDKALHHISEAVKFGFKDFDKINQHDDLAFVRIQPEFDNFKNDGFILKSGNEQDDKNSAKHTEEIEEPITDDVLLSQLNKLAELRKKGLLSENEFAMERKKLLRK